ncbi:MAG TPA: glycosyltransferase, partial [Phycisphaerae bacterium]|nr:glycosyltransferase [Phycisphaerae bacterium]
FGHEALFAEEAFSLAESLAAADAAVFFHKRDCGVTALAAAMAAGLPIACSDTPDARECTRGGRAAVLAQPASPPSAAAAALKLIEDHDLASRCARAAAAIAAENFAPDACRTKLREVHAAAAAHPALLDAQGCRPI